jgi:hypothetical protein
MLGSAVSILGFLTLPRIISKIGNYTTALWSITLQIALFYGLITSTSPSTIFILFVLQTANASMIGLCLDIFLEGHTDGNNVGKIRGFYTSILNASWVISPLIGSIIINGNGDYKGTYFAAMAMLFPLIYMVYKNFPRFHDPKYTHPSVWQLVQSFGTKADWTRIFIINIILQVFYAWMVVYSPIYMNKTLNFGWESIGIMLTIMLIPFPLIQYPLGKLADRKYGEQEIMALGFAIMGVSTILLTTMAPTIFIWGLILFTTRIGAAAAEIMIETYFFKTVPPTDSSKLGLFRITRPIAYFIAPLITMIGLLFTDHEHLFVIIGVLCLLALHPVLTLKDTK